MNSSHENGDGNPPVSNEIVQRVNYLTLSSASTKRKFTFLINFLDKTTRDAGLPLETRVTLQRIEDGKLLHLVTDSESKAVFKSSRPNRNNIFVFEPTSAIGGDLYRIRTLFGKDSSAQLHKSAWYIALSETGELTASLVQENNDCNDPTAVFVIQQYSDVASTESPTISLKTEPVERARALLSKPQLRRFVLEGYLHLSNVISLQEIQTVRKLLHYQLGQIGSLVPGAIQGGNYGKFGGEMTNHPALRSLVVNTQLRPILEQLLGSSIFNQSNLSCQVAFRFPEFATGDCSNSKPSIDWHTDGERQGVSHPFTLLVGICLSDVQEMYSGNLTVWPTSHYLMHRCKNSSTGRLDLLQLKKMVTDNPSYAGMNRVFDESMQGDTESESLVGRNFFGGELQLNLRAGDVVVMHSDMAHGGAPNWSDAIREMVYFRIKHSHGNKCDYFANWDEVVSAQLVDMWCDLTGLLQGLQHELAVLSELYSV